MENKKQLFMDTTERILEQGGETGALPCSTETKMDYIRMVRDEAPPDNIAPPHPRVRSPLSL